MHTEKIKKDCRSIERPLLSRAIERSVKWRIAAAIGFLFLSVFAGSVYQIRSSFITFQEELTKTAQHLSEQVVSEILVQNTQAIDLILESEAKRSLFPMSIILQASMNTGASAKIIMLPDLTWFFDFPLVGFGDLNQGVLHFSGKIFELPFVVDEIAIRALPPILVASILLLLLLPFVRKLPEQLIQNPVNEILASVKDDHTNLSQNGAGFQEIYSIKQGIFELIQRNKSLEDARVQVERDRAIAQMTQALAHDVRKPFTMFRMIIDTIAGEDDPIKAKQLLQELLPEVQQAMVSVNGMISDVLEIGSTSAPIAEPTNPETLIEATLNEIFRVYPESNVNIGYALVHKSKLTSSPT